MKASLDRAPGSSILFPRTRRGIPLSEVLLNNLWSSFFEINRLSTSAASTTYLPGQKDSNVRIWRQYRDFEIVEEDPFYTLAGLSRQKPSQKLRNPDCPLPSRSFKITFLFVTSLMWKPICKNVIYILVLMISCFLKIKLYNTLTVGSRSSLYPTF